MMGTQTEIPIGHPMRDAWEAYKETEEFKNSQRWANIPEFIDGSLWTAFRAGYEACQN